MKNYLTGILPFILTFFAVSIFSFSVKASSDTTILLANNNSKPVSNLNLSNVVVNANNVVYSANLQNNREQTLEYVENFSKKRRDYLIRLYKNGKKYFPKVVSILNKYQLPQELKVLIALESGFNANALSKAGALGYWQIMDEAAKEYGLHILSGNQNSSAKNKLKDDRKNFLKSTLAAARYLKDRCRNLNNDLLLIVASYNCGVGNVWEAMRKSGKDSPTFWDVKKYLPAETRNYVMNFITLNVIFDNYDKFINNRLAFVPAASEQILQIQNTAIDPALEPLSN